MLKGISCYHGQHSMNTIVNALKFRIRWINGSFLHVACQLLDRLQKVSSFFFLGPGAPFSRRVMKVFPHIRCVSNWSVPFPRYPPCRCPPCASGRSAISTAKTLVSGSLSKFWRQPTDTYEFSPVRCWGRFEVVAALPDDLAGRAWP